MEVKYTCLREEFLTHTEPYIDNNVLSTLKDYYARCIDSNRKLSYIKDLRTLLRVLEKRDALNYSNVEPLVYISNNFLNNSYMQNKIKDYKTVLQSMQCASLYDVYKDTNVSVQSLMEHENNSKTESSSTDKSYKLQSSMCNIDQTTSHRNTRNVRSHSEQEEMLQQMVLSRVSERIGRSWRDTARFLGIREHQIDEIQNKYPFDMKEQSYEALRSCISQYSADAWKLNLIRALEKARRKDLRELVEELIIHTRF